MGRNVPKDYAPIYDQCLLLININEWVILLTLSIIFMVYCADDLL